MGRLNWALTTLLFLAFMALVVGGVIGGLRLLQGPEDQEAAHSPSAPLQTAERGDAQETPTSLIQIEEVDSINEFPPLVRSASPQRRSSAPPRSTPLDELKIQMGVVYVPSYVPAGFTLSQSSARSLIYQSGRRQIAIYQDSVPGSPTVKRGYLESIFVNGQPGYLIRGIWTRLVTEGKPSSAEWDPEVALTLMFQIGDRWFRLVADLEAEPFEGAEAELLRMAESLAPY